MTGMAVGLGWSIYFMLILVFTIMGSIVFLVYRTIQNDAKREAERKSAVVRERAQGTAAPEEKAGGPTIARSDLI